MPKGRPRSKRHGERYRYKRDLRIYTPWSDDDVKKLLQIWGEQTMQKKIRESKVRWPLYEIIVRRLKDEGVDRTLNQVIDKIKNLFLKYNKVKNANRAEDWEYFDALHEIRLFQDKRIRFSPAKPITSAEREDPDLPKTRRRTLESQTTSNGDQSVADTRERRNIRVKQKVKVAVKEDDDDRTANDSDSLSSCGLPQQEDAETLKDMQRMIDEFLEKRHTIQEEKDKRREEADREHENRVRELFIEAQLRIMHDME